MEKGDTDSSHTRLRHLVRSDMIHKTLGSGKTSLGHAVSQG